MPDTEAPTAPRPDADHTAVEDARAREHLEAARRGRLAQEEQPTATGRDAITAVAAEGKRPSEETQQNALAWFLDAEGQEEHTKTINLNVGGSVDEDGNALDPDNPPKWIGWTVRSVDLDTIKKIRRMSVSGGRQRRRGGGGEFDETQFNLGLVVEATVDPDMGEVVQKTGIQDARRLVKDRFAFKSGLVGQIVNEILDLSGYNENDVRDGNDTGGVTEEVTAAGN